MWSHNYCFQPLGVSKENKTEIFEITTLNTCTYTDLSFVRRQGLCLNTLYVRPFYSECSDSPGKISLCRRQMERFSVGAQIFLKTGVERRNGEKQRVGESTLTASSRPCRRWFPRSSASGSRGCWPCSYLDTYSTCKHEVQLC